MPFWKILPAILGVGTAIAGVVGAKRRARDAASAARAQADVTAQSAAIRRADADYARQIARMEAAMHMRAGRRLMAEQKARFGGAGVMLQGTPLETLAEQAYQLSLDNQLILHEGEMRARGYEREAASFDTQVGEYHRQARAARGAGRLDAFGHLLGGAVDVYDRWPRRAAPRAAPGL